SAHFMARPSSLLGSAAVVPARQSRLDGRGRPSARKSCASLGGARNPCVRVRRSCAGGRLVRVARPLSLHRAGVKTMLRIKDIMTRDVYTVDASASAEEAAWGLTRRHIGVAPARDAD